MHADLEVQVQNLTSGQGQVRSRVTQVGNVHISRCASARETHWNHSQCSISILSKAPWKTHLTSCEFERPQRKVLCQNYVFANKSLPMHENIEMIGMLQLVHVWPEISVGNSLYILYLFNVARLQMAWTSLEEKMAKRMHQSWFSIGTPSSFFRLLKKIAPDGHHGVFHHRQPTSF